MESKESRIFKRFIKIAFPGLSESSFELLKPPLPDIKVMVSDSDEIYFELAEIIDSNFAQRLGILSRTNRMLKESFAGEPQNVKDSYKNAIIWIRFQPGSSIRERENSYSKISEFIKILPSDFIGSKFFEGLAFSEIEITRGDFVGPIIDQALEANSLSDPLLSILSKKLSKTYSSPKKPNLLLYYEIQPHHFSPDQFSDQDFWTPKFESLWIYDDYEQKCYIF